MQHLDRVFVFNGPNMRITELLEGTEINDLRKFVKHSGDKSELNFDIAEDMKFFMHNNDDLYRRHVYPVIARCAHRIANHKATGPAMFREAVQACYDAYIKKYPIRELSDDLDDKTCKQICANIYEELCNDIKEGKYKD